MKGEFINPRCEKTGKVKYRTKNEARLKIALHKKSVTEGVLPKEPTAFYKCKFCKQYHLTTKEQT